MSISVSKTLVLSENAQNFLVEDEVNTEIDQEFTNHGGFLSGGKYAWMSHGPKLQVIDVRTGSQIGCWVFGSVVKDLNTRVVHVDEIARPYGSPLLAVAIDCDFGGGMLCIFDFIISKVMRAIHVTDRISSLHVIDSGCDVFTLPSPFRCFDGIVAVGLVGGSVFLIDICIQSQSTSGEESNLMFKDTKDELNPCQLNTITPADIGQIEKHKQISIQESLHLSVHLNAVPDKTTKHFVLKGPKGDDRIHVNEEEVAVSALFYCPQLGSLLVGYNFGALQLYNLMDLRLVYTSPVCDEHIPVSHFSVQIPADDPRAFCYVWVVYSSDLHRPSVGFPLAVLYAFNYDSKEHHEGYGILYQDFSSASVRFQMELALPSSEQVNFNRPTGKQKARGGECLRIISCPINVKSPSGQESNAEEDSTLCCVVWKVWWSDGKCDTFMGLFDLNQWYKEHMPDTLSSASYLVQSCISQLLHSAVGSDSVLDVQVQKSSLQQFVGAQKPEEHFCPISLSFKSTCLGRKHLISLQHCGVQKALLAQIESSGPSCLLEPSEIYHQIVVLGMTPLFVDSLTITPISTNEQREIILGAALENELIGWLCKCAAEWANGSFIAAGCSLDFLLKWAFHRATTLKSNSDVFCVTLFDYSHIKIDNNTIYLLNNCIRQLRDICSLYSFVLVKQKRFVPNLELIHEQFQSLQKVAVYFEMLHWLLNVGLLPEYPPDSYPLQDEFENIHAPFPGDVLAEFYKHRRAMLKVLNEERFFSKESIMFIDNLIDKVCGGQILQEQWRSDGGSGFYPPLSIQALLRTYLLDNVELCYKHSLMMYVFLDLAMALDQDWYKPIITHLIKFPTVFKVSSSVIKIVQAFWQLDHGDCNTAMGLLLDPLISAQDLKEWHHKIALRSFMLQEHENFALMYIQIRKPPITEDDDIFTVLSLYVSSNNLDEAFYFQKNFTGRSNSVKFLDHLFNELSRHDKLRSIIYRCLDPNEEKFFLDYLNSKRTENPNCDDLIVYYHIVRSHFMEAFEQHTRFIGGIQTSSLGLEGQRNAIPRDKMVNAMKRLLPEINRKVLKLCQKERNAVFLKVSRPTPLSVFVHNTTENVQYKSTLVKAALAKARQTFNDTLSQNRQNNLDSEQIPFLRTPTMTPRHKRRSTVIVNATKSVETDVDTAPTPVKRLILTPKAATTPSLLHSVATRLDTPVVKRKIPSSGTMSTVNERSSIANTPQSILKVRSSQKSEKTQDFFRQEGDIDSFTTPASKKFKSPSSRKSATPVVRFEGLRNSTSSGSGNSSRNLWPSPENVSPRLSSGDEIFYSPNQSNEEAGQETQELSTQKETEKVQESREESPIRSPRGRKSYKKNLVETPVRTSPRTSRRSDLYSPQTQTLATSSQETTLSPKSTSIPDPSEGDQTLSSSSQDDSVSSPSSSSDVGMPKLRPRKSLCRQVLETNALNRAISSTLDSPILRSSAITNSPSLSHSVEKSVTTSQQIESKILYGDGEEVRVSTISEKHSLVVSFEEENSKIEHSSSKINTSIPNDELIKSNENEKSDDVIISNVDSSKTSPKVHSALAVGSSIAEQEVEIDNTELSDKEDEEDNMVMDVDDDDDKDDCALVYDDLAVIEEEQFFDDKNKEMQNADLVYADLSNMGENVSDNEDGDDYAVMPGDVSKRFAQRRSTDPEMNVFEISDEIVPLNQAVIIEEDVSYYEEPTIERVIEENLDSPLSDLEKNVFNEELSIQSEVSQDEDEESQTGQHGPKKEAPNTVIEILSSSSEQESISSNSEDQDDQSEDEDDEDEGEKEEKDHAGEENEEEEEDQELLEDEEKSSASSASSAGESSSSSSSGSKLEIAYEKNIFDTLIHNQSSDESEEADLSSQRDDEPSVEIKASDDSIREGELFWGQIPYEKDDTSSSSGDLNLFSDKDRIDKTVKRKEAKTERSQNIRTNNIEAEAEAETVKEVESEALPASPKRSGASDSIKDAETQLDTINEEDETVKNKEDEIKEPKNIASSETEPPKPESTTKEVVIEKLVQETESLTPRRSSSRLSNASGHSGEVKATTDSFKEGDLFWGEISCKQDESNVSDELDLFDEKDRIDKTLKRKSRKTIGPQPANTPPKSAPIKTAKEGERDLLLTPRRSSRRLSTASNTSANAKPIEPDEDVKHRISPTPINETPLKARLRKNSTESAPRTPPRTRRNSHEDEAKITEKQPIRRTRSASLDEPSTSTSVPPKRQRVNPRNTRATSVTLPDIPEENKPPQVSSTTTRSGVEKRRAQSVVDDYTSSRRMTRRQLSLLKGTLRERPTSDRSMDLSLMDPLVLLDRPDFEGPADPEENKVYETSPSTTASTSSSPVKAAPAKRTLRSASQTSDASETKSSKLEAGKRVTRKNSGSSNKATDIQEAVPSPKRSLRTRTNSVSSAGSDKSSTSRQTRSKAKSGLPQIDEKDETPEPEKGKPKTRTSKKLFKQ